MAIKLQEWFFKEALAEHGLDNVEFEIDHKNGQNIINEYSVGIKYPTYFLKNIAKLDHTKKYDYCFVGSTSDGLGRSEIIEKYHQYNSKLEHSRRGRDPKTKYKFDTTYYQTMASSRFGLAPGHPQMPKHPNRWTYRLIEAAFCRAIPVQFEETPYGDSFVRDIFYVWNSDIPCKIDNLEDILEENYSKAVKYWTLQPDEIEEIKRQIK